MVHARSAHDVLLINGREPGSLTRALDGEDLAPASIAPAAPVPPEFGPGV